MGPKGDRVVATLWDQFSTHYDLLIPEGDNFVLFRSRQLQHFLSCCSLQSQLSTRMTRHTTEKSQLQMNIQMNIRSQSSQDYEEVNYGSSSLEEVYEQYNSKDFD